MHTKLVPDYLAGYPEALVLRVHQLIAQGRLAGALLKRYPLAHEVRTDKALYDFVQQMKNAHLRNAERLHRVAFDSRLLVLHNALGLHSRSSRPHGANLRSKREILIAAVFRNAPPEFLRMIVVHELAHLKESGHGKAFHQLCRHMETDYAQLEFDVRVYLTYLDAGGTPLWGAISAA